MKNPVLLPFSENVMNKWEIISIFCLQFLLADFCQQILLAVFCLQVSACSFLLEGDLLPL